MTLMHYKFANYHTREVVGEVDARSATEAAHKICREKYGVNYDTALAEELLKRKDLTITATKILKSVG